MVREDIAASGVTNTRVLESMRLTPRHEFVAAAQRPLAYYDMSLPIGDRQTISGPFVVAYMTEQLDPKPTDRVLEIGTGSGYQAAVLSPLVGTVYSIEIHEALGRRARSTLRRLGYTNVVTKIGDGFMGWEEKGPFDKIIVTCSPEEIPLPLIDQLVEDGIMIIPVGERYEQTLVRLQKRAGELERTDLVPSLFVPMTGEAEERRAVLPNGVKPRLANSSFEECLPDSETPTAWYYGRQEALLENDNSPDGRRHLLLKNSEPGRPAHIFQGFPIDGLSVRELKISYQVRVAGLGSGRIPAEKPGVAIRFFDERRARSTRLVAPLRILNSEWDPRYRLAIGAHMVQRGNSAGGTHGCLPVRLKLTKSKSSRLKDLETRVKRSENIISGMRRRKNAAQNGGHESHPAYVFPIFYPSFLLYPAVKLF
jgi:protein-L-isoaspartate(D-aspartate) O-methyltransferase